MPGMRTLVAACVAALALLAPGLAEAKWLKAETKRFNIYTNGSEMALRDYAVKLEDYDTLLRVFFGLDPNGVPERKLDIYMVADTIDMRRVSPRAPETLAGFYTASSYTIFAIGKRGSGGPDNDDTILHEYAHHFMLQQLSGSYPGWLIEGFAEYYMTANLKPGSFEIGDFNTGRAYTLMNGKWTPTEVVLTKRTGELKGDQVMGYYAQSWLMTHYMLSDPVRRKQLFAYVRLLGEGKESVAAWTEATGESIATLDLKLHAYIKKGVPSIRFTRPSYQPAAVTVTTLPKAADDLLLESLRATLTGCGGKRDVDDDDDEDEKDDKKEADVLKATKERAAFVEKVRTRAALHPADGLAQRTLACVELEYGDAVRGMTILDQLIAANPADATSLRMKATVMLAKAYDVEDPAARRSQMNDAGRLLLKANAAEPNEYRTLLYYARSRMAERDYPNDNVLDVLHNAAKLAPQVDEVRIEAARALIIREQYDEAERLLIPVANNPHGASGAAIARSMLKEIAAAKASAGK